MSCLFIGRNKSTDKGSLFRAFLFRFFKVQLTSFFVDCILLSFSDKPVPCTGEEGEDLTFLRNPRKPLETGSRGEI